MEDRVAEIHAKGFDMTGSSNEEYDPYRAIDYAKLKVGLRSIENPITDVNYFKKANPKADKESVLRAIKDNNLTEMRALSDFFYKGSGIYARLCRYMAYLYRYDWVITPVVLNDKINPDKITEGFYKSLVYLDNFNPKKVFGEIALKVVRYGAFYGYKVVQGDKLVIQELPVAYCRTRYSINGKPAVEFNMRYFDETFPDASYRARIIKVFPKEFAAGYVLWKQGKLPADFAGDQDGWYLLDPKMTEKFNLNAEDTPLLISVVPSILDLEEAKELDRKKMQQQLLKILIQKMPLDKNGELIFDVDEAQALHNNAVRMLQQAIGVDVLTTFAEVDVQDLADRSTTTTIDEINKVERSVFNEAGVSQMQFNTNGNLALEKSIANDEASMYGLIAQFEQFLNELLAPFNKTPKKLYYKAQILTTTIYNYERLAKLYKEQMAMGFSKMLPQIALGQSQSLILATAYFENEVLNLNELFLPPASSNTTPGGKAAAGGDGPGRPEKPNDEKSDKTIKNKESMS